MDSETNRQVVDGASDAIVVADVAGTKCYRNVGAEALFGHRAVSALASIA
jgi:hypothetical protein